MGLVGGSATAFNSVKQILSALKIKNMFQSLKVSLTKYYAHFSDPLMLSDIVEAAWFVSILGSGSKRRGVLQSSLVSLTLSRRWSALGHCGMYYQNPQVFPYSHYLLKTKMVKKRARHLGTPAHCVDRTGEKEVKDESQQSTNGCYVPGTGARYFMHILSCNLSNYSRK